MNSELYEEELAALRAQLAAQSRTLAEKAQQVENLRAELSEMGDAGVEKVRGLEAELEGVRERLAASEAAWHKAEQQLFLANRGKSLLLDQQEKAAADFRARVKAEFARLRAGWRMLEGDADCDRDRLRIAQIVNELIAAETRLMGGGA